jgi:hypothetical protein
MWVGVLLWWQRLFNFFKKAFEISKTSLYLQSNYRARSSVGSEHLVYTQGVRGSNPFAPTKVRKNCGLFLWVINSVGLECYLDRVEVTGSNPV